MNEFTLRNVVATAKEYYLNHALRANVELFSESENLLWAVQEYGGGVGSVMEFTADDWVVCRENELTIDDVCDLLNEPYFYSWISDPGEALEAFRVEHVNRWGYYEEPTAEEEADFLKGFRMWRETLLPVAEAVYIEDKSYVLTWAGIAVV